MISELWRSATSKPTDQEIQAYYDHIKSGANYHAYVVDYEKVLRRFGEAGYSWIRGYEELAQNANRQMTSAIKRVLGDYDRKIMRTDQRIANRHANFSLGIALLSLAVALATFIGNAPWRSTSSNNQIASPPIEDRLKK